MAPGCGLAKDTASLLLLLVFHVFLSCCLSFIILIIISLDPDTGTSNNIDRQKSEPEPATGRITAVVHFIRAGVFT